MADNTKSRGELMGYTLLDDTGGVPFVKSPDLDNGEGLDSNIRGHITVVMAHNDANDAAANFASAIVETNSGADVNGWKEYIRKYATGGQANAQQLDAATGLGQGEPARVYVGSTTNFEIPGSQYFLKDAGTLANSCLIRNVGYANDDYIINIDNLAKLYDNADFVYDIVDIWKIKIPPETQQLRVIFTNPDGDATYACKIDYSLVTDFE